MAEKNNTHTQAEQGESLIIFLLLLLLLLLLLPL
jgi:Tfp pilus assembly protein PilX